MAFVDETSFYNRIVLSHLLPASLWEHLPHFLQTWLRNYLAGNLLYFISGFLWCFYIYYLKLNVYLPQDAIPTRKAMLLQIHVAVKAMPCYTLLPTVSEYMIESGWTRCYSSIGELSWFLYFVSIATYLVLVEFGIYWMHRELHDIKPLYKHLHATHHIYNKQNTLSPFAGLAFHPVDGILQAVPHVIALFIVPIHFTTHLGLLFMEAIWTANIHDCIHGNIWPVMGAGYHTIHHTTYKHNYGHYTIWMDWMFGSLKDPLLEDFVDETTFYNRIVLSHLLPANLWEPLPRFLQTWLRSYLTGNLFYFISAFLWCFYIYYLKRNVYIPEDSIPTRKAMIQQIHVAVKGMPWYTLFPTVSEYMIERGWTKCYSTLDQFNWFLCFAYIVLYLVIVEFGMYWVHKGLHDIKFLYKHLHATHHMYNKQNTLSPFAGFASHPLDGILQAAPHVIALFIVPVHLITHMSLLFLGGMWTTCIHDCIHGNIWPIMGAGYHTIHHTTYKHNYGQYTICMDWMFGTLEVPSVAEDNGLDQKANLWEPLPHFLQTWLRNYLAGNLLYFISGFLWCFYIYYLKLNVYIPKDSIPTRKAMILQIHVAMKAMPWYTLLPTVSEYMIERGLAFHPLDGILQAVPHVIALFIVPIHLITHLSLLFLEGIWTASIHDCIHGNIWPIMGAGYHTIHHTTYKHNYGHYTIWMDWMFGTLKVPLAEDDNEKAK
ncbi:hypothetical protein HID58_010894 [Brassica napus]|uniref:Fatty acid hydroxylase domain-containing protein n=1 Tax=Brassica napus TaxID=3708 RepID=A0ABQ8DWK5_BRANA|nr:hypothetical protein HID58_010894 [Brassica napus]